MSPVRARHLGVVLATGLVMVLAGCAPQDGDNAAGTLLTATTGSAAPDTGAPPPPSRAEVDAAGLDPCPRPAADAAPAAGGLPDLTLPCLGDGPAVPLAGLRGTPMVLNVWTSWCGPCRDELPVLAEVAAQAGERVRFLGVDVADFDPAAALQLLTDAGVSYPSVVDYGQATKPALRWVGPPMTVLVRADGTVAYRWPSPVTSADQLRELIATHLGVDVAT
ncbi:MAG TPA: TlpA disulfide reductase family protein [Candidatus Nanopelagicales bacterium]|jgi:thiol-disulfide isomerase/thioredoxin|nr:TlpA disulfide reductase family protein [Candidatus Nanopelagicales bacterium]